MSVNPDFKDLFSELSARSARFLVVGAHAVMYYAEPRYTKGLDIGLLGLDHLIANKRAVGRLQDQLDLKHLARAKGQAH
jgi:hypothetical protein